MDLPDKQEIKDRLKTLRKEFPRPLVAKKLGIATSTLNKCLSTEPMSDTMRYELAKLLGMIQTTPTSEQIIPDNILHLKVPHEDFANWEKAALQDKSTVSDWLLNAGNEMAEKILEREFNITQLPKKQAHTMAAAGSEIQAEVIGFKKGDRVLVVKVCGDSMSPLLESGELLDMAPRSLSNSEYMKKGLIYLVRTPDGYTIKRYGTRKAREDETDAEYLTSNGTVGVLKSENPDYDDIDITDTSVDWEAWIDAKGSYPKGL